MPATTMKLIRTADVAELVGMSHQDVRKAAREGDLPAYRLPGGRVYLFFLHEVQRWHELQDARAAVRFDDETALLKQHPVAPVDD